jgi:antitoxin MazE
MYILKKDIMQVSKWGNSLALRLPKALADALGIREGDEATMVPQPCRTISLGKEERRAMAVEGLRALNRIFIGVAVGPAAPPAIETHRPGDDIARNHGFQIDDSMNIASASLAGCSILHNEGRPDGAVIAGVQIRDPFNLPDDSFCEPGRCLTPTFSNGDRCCCAGCMSLLASRGSARPSSSCTLMPR